MKKTALLFLFFVSACLPESASQADAVSFDTATIEIERENLPPLTIKAEIAQTNEQRERGLMFRTEMADDAGMLFDFKAPRRITMWMANTPLSLDMFFIDKTGVIRQITEYTVPFSRDVIASEGKMLGVLEMKAGSARRFGITEGSRVKYSAFEFEK